MRRIARSTERPPTPESNTPIGSARRSASVRCREHMTSVYRMLPLDYDAGFTTRRLYAIRYRIHALRAALVRVARPCPVTIGAAARQRVSRAFDLDES